MSILYRYDHHRRKHQVNLVILSFVVAFVGIASIVYFVYQDISVNEAQPVEGVENSVAQVLGGTESYLVNEEAFDFELPADWREIDRVQTTSENSITWQATLKNEDNRYLTLHMNTIPQDPIVRLLPVTVDENQLRRGQLSANCATFTGSGTSNASERRGQPPAPAKWENIDFICDIPNIVDQNVIGTAQAGQPLNTFTVTGEDSGTNQYSFVYTDRNVRPNFDILYNAVSTFFAK
jgi:hypothetical protein